MDGQLSLLAENAAGWYGITSEMVSSVFDSIKELLPILCPAVFTLWGFRKGWSFLRGLIKGA